MPIGGIHVIDVSSFLAGPICSTQLGELGADALKLELPMLGDPLRKSGTVAECGETLP